MALTVFLSSFYPLFVFFAGQTLGADEGLILDRPLDSRYGNRISQNRDSETPKDFALSIHK